jgi:hypothetical protein
MTSKPMYHKKSYKHRIKPITHIKIMNYQNNGSWDACTYDQVSYLVQYKWGQQYFPTLLFRIGITPVGRRFLLSSSVRL